MQKLTSASHHAQRRLGRLTSNHYIKDRRVWGGVGAVLILVLWVLPTFAAQGPGQVGYSIKRSEQALAASLTPIPSWRQALQLDFANDRVSEAAYVANQANQSGDKNPAKTAKTINSLLDSYETTYEARTASLNQGLENGAKPSKADATHAQKDAVNTYTTLEALLLQAPDASQLAVLTAIDDTQQNIATLSDALGAVPLSASDFSQLAKLVSAGVVSQSDVNQLASARSSRQLHAQTQKLVESGNLPSDLSYILDLDLVKRDAASKAQVFETVAQFGQLQRISAVITASRPTAAQQQAVQAFLARYTAGQTVPDTDIHQYVTPIVDGVVLSGQLQVNLPSLNTIHMSGDDQALFDSWKGVLDPPNLSVTYQRLMTGAQSQPALHLRILTTTQQELVDAQKAQVAYLVMPPGWSADQLALLSNQMATSIAEVSYQQSNPNTAQELARLATVQQQLQTTLNSLNATYNDNSTKLQTQINNFTGTPEQLAQLKSDLANLTQNQTTTINDLQTQLTAITNAHTQLGDSIASLRREQITNLTELELRAASNAQQLNDATKAQLTASLNQVNAQSQTLISNLQTQVDNLGTNQATLREELTATIQTTQDNYTQLAATTQAQIDTGVAASAQMQTQLQTVQTSLSQHATQLASLSSSNTALNQLITQVQSDSSTQVSDLQGQINGLTISQQTIRSSLSDLKNKHAADITQLSSQLAGLSVLQVEAQATITNLTQTQAQAQSSIDHLTTNFDTLQTAFTTAQQAQAAIQTTIANQQSEIDSLQTQTQAALDTLTQQQTQLASQLAGLAANTTTLSQAVSSLQSSSAATQTQLTTLLANPPWALATNAYVTQDQLNSLSAQLDTQFAQKSAQLDQQFQTYQTQLNASVTQLNNQVQSLSTTTANTTATQTQQQAQINTLNTQVQTLQSQVQTLINASAPPTGL
jgi:hypothetical protein